MANEQKPIFLSHSYHDKDLADRLIKLLTNGCDVSPNDILCTSLPGKDIKVGEPDFIKYLKEQLANPTLVILLITENYIASSFCLAELGAVWRMGFDCFPLAVKPIERSEIGGVLAVVQAGDISQENYLDQLQVKIKDVFGKGVPTPAWTVEKDVFLNGLDALIKKMKKPDVVKRAELEKVQGQYTYALESIKKKDGEIGKLKNQITDLEKLKDKEQVREVAKKYSTTTEQFDALCEAVKEAFGPLHQITIETIYRDRRGHVVPLDSREKSDEAVAAEDVKQVVLDERGCTLNTENQKVWDAKRALDELDTFISNIRDNHFLEEFEAENGYLPDVTDKNFWKDHLANI